MHIVLLILGLIAVCVIASLAVRTIGCNCYECGRRMAYFDELAEPDKREILTHFEQIEERRPNASAIFVCTRCRVVHDDFSGEERSLDADGRSYCKVCNGVVQKVVGRIRLRGPAGHGDLRSDAGRDAGSPSRAPTDGVGDQDGDSTPGNYVAWLYRCHLCGTHYAWLPFGESGYKFFTPFTDKDLLDRARDICMGRI